MTNLVVGTDINGRPTWSYNFTNINYSANLTAGNEITLDVPANMTKALFKYEPGATVWVGFGSSAITLPINNTFNSTIGQMNPDLINVEAGLTLRFVTQNTTANVGVSFYEE